MCIIFTYLFALLIHKKCPLPYLFQTPKLHNYIQNKYLISTFLRILTPIITFSSKTPQIAVQNTPLIMI